MTNPANDNPPQLPPAPGLRRIPIVGEIGPGDVVTFYDRPTEFVDMPAAGLGRALQVRRDGRPKA